MHENRISHFIGLYPSGHKGPSMAEPEPVYTSQCLIITEGLRKDVEVGTRGKVQMKPRYIARQPFLPHLPVD